MTEPLETAVAYLNESDIARFWSKVDKPGPDMCWTWRGSLCNSGYGQFGIHRRGIQKGFRAHRIAFELSGFQHNGLVLDHLCRNRACVNPDHLEAVTNKENILRGTSPTAKNAAKVKCSSGHDLSGDNLVIVRTRGRPLTRACRTCRNLANVRFRKAQRGLAVRDYLKEQG